MSVELIQKLPEVSGVALPATPELLKKIKPPRRLKKYSYEEKAMAVHRVLVGGEAQTQVAKSIGTRESTVRGWVTMWQKWRRLPVSGGRKKATEKRVLVPAPAQPPSAPVVVEYVVNYQVTVMPPPAPVITPNYGFYSFNAPTPRIIQQEVALDLTMKKVTPVIEERTPLLPAPTPTSTSTWSVPGKRVRKPTFVKDATVRKLLATPNSKAERKVQQSDVGPVPSKPTPKTGDARRPRGRPRTSSCASGSRGKRIEQCPSAKGASKRKLESPQVPPAKRQRAGSGRLITANEQRIAAAKAKKKNDEPDDRFKTILEAVGLIPNPNPGPMRRPTA